MMLNDPTENSLGIRFGSFVQVRDIMDETFEAIFSGQRTAQQGLDDAVAAGTTCYGNLKLRISNQC
jgi:sn-glycerol 3-phosphate transport system substrate-binding protein